MNDFHDHSFNRNFRSSPDRMLVERRNRCSCESKRVYGYSEGKKFTFGCRECGWRKEYTV